MANVNKTVYAPNTGYKMINKEKNYLKNCVKMFIRYYFLKLKENKEFNNYKELSEYIYEKSGIRVTVNYIATQKRRNFIKNSVFKNDLTLLFTNELKKDFNNFDDNEFYSK